MNKFISDVKRLKMSKFISDVKRLKMNKFIQSVWQLIISTSHATLEIPSLRPYAVVKRDNLQSYFMNRGAVEWQVNHITSCGPVLTV